MSDHDENTNVPTLDLSKIYIIIISALSVLSIVGIIYNYYTLSQYKMRIKQSDIHIEKILEMESQLIPKSDSQDSREIPDVFQFFKRKAYNLSEPQIEESPWEPSSQSGVSFKEKRYTIRFDGGVSRQDLVDYIYAVIESKPFLKLKQLSLQKIENTPPHQDSWKSELVFAYREPSEKD